MFQSAAIDPRKTSARFRAVVKSLSEFDKSRVRGVIKTLLSPKDGENCFIATYYRTLANVDTLLSLEIPRDFQTIAMLSRGIFELAVDATLMSVTPSGLPKIMAYSEVARLKAARQIVEFKINNPTASIDVAVYDSFIKNNEARINAARQTLWPNQKHPGHWSGANLRERVKQLKAPFEQIYEIHYPQLSWYVHSGLTGVINLQAETFTAMCGVALNLAAQSYLELLKVIIKEFRIEKANGKIFQELEAARLLPFTDSPEEADQLFEELMQ